uniref:Uncharacterized protein n=1 Tax=Arundo donax TaxID=35708 RepID=A0A0A9BYU6_ARUDO
MPLGICFSKFNAISNQSMSLVSRKDMIPKGNKTTFTVS